MMVTKELPCALHFLFLFKMGIELDINDSDKPMRNGMYCWMQEMARGQKTFTELVAEPRNAGRLILIFQPLFLYGKWPVRQRCGNGTPSKTSPKQSTIPVVLSGLLRLETALVMLRATANQVNVASIRPLQIPIGKYLYILNKELNLLEPTTAILGYET
nr:MULTISPECIES: hypothetical protein [Bifidobacterium]